MKKTKVFILTLLIFLSGCAPTTEIDKLMIVSGISVFLNHNKLQTYKNHTKEKNGAMNCDCFSLVL